jgi:hypothetical protein
MSEREREAASVLRTRSGCACLELEGGEGVGGAGEQDGGVELLLEAVAEAAPWLRVEHQPPRHWGRLPGRSGAEEAGSGCTATRRDEADGRGAREERG